jgi:Domain of Unknown Function (DUF1080)/Peptidase of plants and bacteria
MPLTELSTTPFVAGHQLAPYSFSNIKPMKCLLTITLAASALLLAIPACLAETKIVVDYNDTSHASADFKFKTVPAPAKANAATKASFTIVDGQRDQNGGDLGTLHDGKLPTEEDQPSENFFFNAGTDGGRLLVDLGGALELRQVNTYSWHPGTRGPQVYKLYASDGEAGDFNAKPKRGTDPLNNGWKLIAKVDTRPKTGEGGGQYGVSISDTEGAIGKYRYLLFDIANTETDDGFGNTFYSEIAVIDKAGGTGSGAGTSEPAKSAYVIPSADGYCQISIDTSGAPDLQEWAETKLAPVLAQWYPKLTIMLASDGYSAPTNFSVIIRPGRGVAATGGGRVTANSTWLKRELNGEAVGALLHEEVHVVQRYGGGRRNNPDYKPTPGWLTEGIPDYIRWFLYEPQSHGADVAYFRTRRNPNLNYDGLYRVSANFLNYVIETYAKDKNLITKVNAACREGKYTDDLWKELTGKSLPELNDEWKAEMKKELAQGSGSVQAATAEGSAPNALTDAEKVAGWKLLFNGKDFTGWHNFKRQGVLPGWQVKDGALVCADPNNAKDIVTEDQYDWFELQLDYNISEAGNSGIMYHVTDAGGAVWATGPEYQLEDNKAAADKVRCGWLYALYQPPDDPTTGKPLDATKPVGEWNHVRLLISQEKCEHDINGVKYFEYVLGSEDFNNRVAKSKFARMPGFAKSNTGYIALQGDHGQVSFRNIKIRPIAPKP